VTDTPRRFVRREQRGARDPGAHHIGDRRQHRVSAGAFVAGETEREVRGTHGHDVAQQHGGPASADGDLGSAEFRDEHIDVRRQRVARLGPDGGN
jgi:hypothetical protein